MSKNYFIHSELLKKCREQDKNAQLRIYELYYKAIYNTCLRIVSSTAIAEELMQDAFLSAFSKIEQYKEEVAFGAWLKKIAVNKSLDYLKKNKIKWEKLNENIEITQNEELDFELADIDRKQLIEIIRKAIEQLADGHRVILSLFYFEGYDHEEIAQLLGIKNSSSRSQLTRAKSKLKLILSEINDERITKYTRKRATN